VFLDNEAHMKTSSDKKYTLLLKRH